MNDYRYCPASSYCYGEPLAIAEAQAYDAAAERSRLNWKLANALHHDLTGFVSAARFSRRDNWMAYDVSNGRDDARYLGLIPGIFLDPATAPIF